MVALEAVCEAALVVLVSSPLFVALLLAFLNPVGQRHKPPSRT
jgi:hypothetical protein